MIIVGELINASRKAVGAAIEARDKAAIQQVAADQHAAGADFIDVNAGIFVGREAEHLKWLTESVQEVVNGPCSLDSPDPAALEAALAVHKGTAMINSISLEKERFEKLLPVVAGTDLKVVALCMSDAGMPARPSRTAWPSPTNWSTPCCRRVLPWATSTWTRWCSPASVNQSFGPAFLDAIAGIRQAFPEAHTMCGLSNISYGLPNRKFLNQTFMAMAIAKGLDGAIVNPLDRGMMAAITAAEALAGRDGNCMNYLKAHRAGKFEF